MTPRPLHLALASLLVAACASDPSALSKDDARKMGKADGFDFCADNGWYGDGECDDFCLQRDPDCASDSRSPELGKDVTIVRTSRIALAKALAQTEAATGPTIEAKFELDDAGKLSLSVYPVKDLALDSERQAFQELAGDPTARPFAPGTEAFHDQEHLTRSSRDLTLAQLSRFRLAEVVKSLADQGTVYWAIPTIQGHRAGYGVYLLAEPDGDQDPVSEYVFVDGGGQPGAGVEELGVDPGDGATDTRVPELGADLTIVRTSHISMSAALAKLEKKHGPAIEAKFELGDDGKLSLSVYPVKDLALDAERQHFFELAGDPTATSFRPSKSEFVVPDEEHLTRAARDLTLVQTASLSLRDAVSQAEAAVPGATVFWAIPTRRDTRAGYGIYLLGKDGVVHYLFVS